MKETGCTIQITRAVSEAKKSNAVWRDTVQLQIKRVFFGWLFAETLPFIWNWAWSQLGMQPPWLALSRAHARTSVRRTGAPTFSNFSEDLLRKHCLAACRQTMLHPKLSLFGRIESGQLWIQRERKRDSKWRPFPQNKAGRNSNLCFSSVEAPIERRRWISKTKEVSGNG